MLFNKFDIPPTKDMKTFFDFVGLDENEQRAATRELYTVVAKATAHDALETVKQNPGKFLLAFIAGAITF